MSKKFIIFALLSLSWCLALGLYVYWQIETMYPIVQPTGFSAAVALAQEKPAGKPVTILAFGDMMLIGGVRGQINKNGPEYPFALIKDFLKGNDIVVANAEGPFTDNPSVTLGKKGAPLQFTFDPAILPTLKNLGFTLLSQANNHALNFGMAGLQQSTSSIEAAGLHWFGNPFNENVVPYVAEIGGERVAFIGYHEFAEQGLDNVLQAIKDAKKYASFIVVYPHWGVEYYTNFTDAQQKTAHEFIDAGADVVIGAHPHVIEPIEMYNGKVIFYSLGNFIFDQPADGPTGQGLSVKISLAPDSVTYDLFPFSIVQEQAALMSTEDRQNVLNNLNVPAGTIIMPRGQMMK